MRISQQQNLDMGRPFWLHDDILCVWGQFFILVFFCLKRHISERYGERFSLSKHERLPPHIGKVMAMNVIQNNPLILRFNTNN